jgi:hypothetical protein
VVAWRLGIKLGSLGISDHRIKHEYFKFIGHPKKPNLKTYMMKYINRVVAHFISYKKLFNVNDDVGVRYY